MKNALNRSSFALGIATILACGGCSGDGTEHDETAKQVEERTSCTSLNEEAAGLQVDWVGTGESKAVQVVNERNVDGALTVTKTTISPDGAQSTELANLVIGAYQQLVFEVPALDANESAKATSLHVTAKVEFSDGELGWDNVASRLIDTSAILDAAIKNTVIKDNAIPDRVTGKAPPISGPIVTHALVTKELCFAYPSMFDVGTGEDFFTEGVPTIRPARGLKLYMYRLENNLPALESILVLDNYGCTGTLTLDAGTKVMKLATQGAVRGVEFEVLNHVESDTVQQFAFADTVVADSATQTFTFDPLDTPKAAAFNAAEAVGYILDRQWSSGAATLTVVVNMDEDTGFNLHTQKIKLKAGKEYGKFTIGHEMGHWTMKQLTDFPMTVNDHNWLWKVTQRTGVSEGFADFFAAMAFNGTTQSGCFYGSINCDQGLSSGGSCRDAKKAWNSVMEHCYDEDPTQWVGRSNELDWSRVFWNMRAPNGVGSPTILSWINTANDNEAWTNENLFSLLDARADAIGGTLNSRFDANKALHGVTH